MNINRVRTLLVLANVGLAAGTGYTVYEEFQNKAARRAQTEKFFDQLDKDLKAVPTAPRREALKASINLSELIDLTGDRPKAPEPVKVEDVPETRILNPLEGIIKVVTISYHTDAALANASITRKTEVAPSGDRSVFRAGDTIPFANDAVVIRINERSVVFLNGDREEELEVSDKLVAGPAAGTSSQPSDPGNRPFGDYIESKKDSGLVTIKQGGDKALSREGEKILEGVRFSTTDASGGGKALKIDSVPGDSVLRKHGVEDGDVLISVDGIPMSTKSEVVEYAKKNKNKPVFHVVFQRRGRLVHRMVSIER